MTTIKKEKLKTKPYVLPETNLIPLNGRIFCDRILRLEQETEGGLSIPSTWFMEDEHGNPTIEVAHNRFIVVAVAHDCNIKVPGPNGHLRKLEPGDEVLPQENPNAVGWTLPVMRDYENDRKEYFVLHESEISGYYAAVDDPLLIQDYSIDVPDEVKDLPQG